MNQIVNEKLKKLFNYFQNGKFEHVIRESRTLLKKFPESPAVHNLLGLSLQQINNFADAKKTVTGQMVTAEDIARVVAFLCSQDANMIRGQVISVDGGMTLTI